MGRRRAPARQRALGLILAIDAVAVGFLSWFVGFQGFDLAAIGVLVIIALIASYRIATRGTDHDDHFDRY